MVKELNSTKNLDQGLLAQAFDTFSAASIELQRNYHNLEESVRELKEELDQKNRDLILHLQEKEEIQNYLDAILQSIGTGVVVADPQGTVTMFNPAAERITECPSTEVVGKDLREVMCHLGLPDDINLEDVLDGNIFSVPNVSYQKKNGSTETLSVSVATLAGRQHELFGIVLLLQDVTELKKLEEEVERHNRLTAMGEMAVKIAHEIRNPLGGIELFASILKKEMGKNDPNFNLIEHILSGVQSLEHILSNLLVFTKSATPVFKSVPIRPLLKETLVFSEGLLKGNSIRLSVEDSFLGWCLWCDEELMKQVFLNLILNAAQAMPSGGELTISIRDLTKHSISYKTVPLKGGSKRRKNKMEKLLGQKEQWVEIKISDTGSGILKEDLNKIFNPFFTRKEKGTGLGLAIVHNILKLHRGNIEVERLSDGGSSFTICLPGEKYGG